MNTTEPFYLAASIIESDVSPVYIYYNTMFDIDTFYHCHRHSSKSCSSFKCDAYRFFHRSAMCNNIELT